MDRMLENSKNLIIIAVVFSLLASVAAFFLGGLRTLMVIWNIMKTFGRDPLSAIALIEIINIFLIATALLIFAVGMYELFIRDIELPEWLTIKNLHDLKAKLGSVIILVMAVTFLKHLIEWRDPQGTYYFGIAVAFVSASIIAFTHFGGKD